MTDNDLRDAIDVVTSCLKDCVNEPTNKEAQQALIVAVRHFNLQGVGFKLTREHVQAFNMKGSVNVQPLHR
jgi:hypothetical protein